MKPGKKDRKKMILEFLSNGQAPCNGVAHAIWRDWVGPKGSGSHPLTRVTGKLLNQMEEDGLVYVVYEKNPMRRMWKITSVGSARLKE